MPHQTEQLPAGRLPPFPPRGKIEPVLSIVEGKGALALAIEQAVHAHQTERLPAGRLPPFPPRRPLNNRNARGHTIVVPAEAGFLPQEPSPTQRGEGRHLLPAAPALRKGLPRGKVRACPYSIRGRGLSPRRTASLTMSHQLRTVTSSGDPTGLEGCLASPVSARVIV